jgi:hypothetical protein
MGIFSSIKKTSGLRSQKSPEYDIIILMTYIIYTNLSSHGLWSVGGWSVSGHVSGHD